MVSAMGTLVDESWGCAPASGVMLKIAQNVLQLVRPELPKNIGEVLIQINELADEEMLEALFLDDPYALRGVYSGIAGALELHAVQTDAEIWLFRQPILQYWIQRGDLALEPLIGHVLLEEIAAHYRWSDDELSRLLSTVGIQPIKWPELSD